MFLSLPKKDIFFQECLCLFYCQQALDHFHKHIQDKSSYSVCDVDKVFHSLQLSIDTYLKVLDNFRDVESCEMMLHFSRPAYHQTCKSLRAAIEGNVRAVEASKIVHLTPEPGEGLPRHYPNIKCVLPIRNVSGLPQGLDAVRAMSLKCLGYHQCVRDPHSLDEILVWSKTVTPSEPVLDAIERCICGSIVSLVNT